MKRLHLLGVLLMLTLAIFLASCLRGGGESPSACAKDSDCVSSTCCHANESVNRESGPSCTGQFCTSECVPNTLDCGQGNLQCVSGKCQITIIKPLKE